MIRARKLTNKRIHTLSSIYHSLFRVWPADLSEMMVGFGLSLFAINTWLLPYDNSGPNGPSWTICTLFFWYWCFPFLLPRLQRLSDRKIAYSIVKYFWLQIGLAVLVGIGCGIIFNYTYEVILPMQINLQFVKI